MAILTCKQPRSHKGWKQSGCSNEWNVGACTWADDGSGRMVTEAQPFKGFSPAGKTRRGEMYGQRFASSDECFVAMHAHGYGTPYHGRNSCSFEVSRASRRHGIIGKTDCLTKYHYTNGLWSAGYRLAKRGLSYPDACSVIACQSHIGLERFGVRDTVRDYLADGWRAWHKAQKDRVA